MKFRVSIDKAGGAVRFPVERKENGQGAVTNYLSDLLTTLLVENGVNYCKRGEKKYTSMKHSLCQHIYIFLDSQLIDQLNEFD